MVERLVAADPGGEAGTADNAQADRGYGGGKHRVGRAVAHLRQRHRPEAGKESHHHGRHRDHRRGQRDQGALAVQNVHQFPGGRAREHGGNPADSQRHARRARLPMLAAGEENREKRPDPALYVGQ